MCGITGIMNVEDTTLLRDMCKNLIHRGPDSSGFFEDNGVGLGIQRLSIIDIKKGNQPISNEDEKIWIIFNGEIYNYKELQKKLIEKGHKFKTNSDTEVIVHAYEEYDLDFVNHLRGIFAIAIWDDKKHRTILARDRLGVKPLYYYIKNNQLLFASELKALLEYDELNPTIDYSSISDYLTYLYIPAPKTIFNEIKKLEPSEILIFNKDGNYEIKKYWKIIFNENHLNVSDTAIQLRQLLEESVNLRMVSDVPVGVLLSGGLDSNTIATIAAEKSPYTLNTYTVGFHDSADKSYDELKESKEMADFLGTNHHEIIVNSDDTIKLLDKVTWQLDEPFGNPTTALNYIICEFASRTSKVVLSGVGGDEIFGGYPKYKALKIFDEYSKFPKSIIKKLAPFFDKLPESTSEIIVKGKTFFNSWKENPIDQYYSLISYFNNNEKENLTSIPLNQSKKLITNLFEESENYGAKNFFQKLFYVECNSYLPNNILEYTDKTSMATSLEVREPLLDHKLVEFSANIPFELKIKNGSMKHILKLAMKDSLPKSVLNRKKRGFTPPLINWLNNSMNDLESTYLSNSLITKNHIVKSDQVQNLINRYKAGKKSNYLKIWCLICLESWFKVFFDKYNVNLPK